MNEQCDIFDGAAVVPASTTCSVHRGSCVFSACLMLCAQRGARVSVMRMVWGKVRLLVNTQLPSSIEHPCGRGNSLSLIHI